MRARGEDERPCVTLEEHAVTCWECGAGASFIEHDPERADQQAQEWANRHAGETRHDDVEISVHFRTFEGEAD